MNFYAQINLFDLIANPVGGARFRTTLISTTKTRRTRRYTEVAHGQSPGLAAPSRSQIIQSFLVLFFKKEQKESTSFLKKRSKKLFRMGLRFNGLIDLLVLVVAVDGFGLRVPWRSSRLRG
jgi:hypothetical protein